MLLALNAELLSHDSATETLQRWCADHQLAAQPRIVARLTPVVQLADANVRALLHAAADEPIRRRRVALVCGTRVLSEADNWYRPGQLTAQMNETLETTDRPFGAVIRPLGFHRRTLETRLLFEPLRLGDKSPHTGDLMIPHAVLRHRAVLETDDGTPVSFVIETYTGDVLSGEK